MSKYKIGVQSMMVAEDFSTMGPYKAIKKMVEMGYDCVELSMVPMDRDSVNEIKRACDELEFTIAAISGAVSNPDKSVDTLTSNLEKFISDCKILDCKYIRIGAMPPGVMFNEESVIDYCIKMEDIASKLKKEGIKLYYHNHHFDFQKINGKRIIEIILENSPSVGIEFDIHWAQRAGVNPASFIKKLKGRLDLLHLKDYRIKRVPEAVREGRIKFDYTDYINTIIEFAEIGEGNLDIKEIILAALETGVQYMLVEQDASYDKTPWESLMISRNNLKKIGF